MVPPVEASLSFGLIQSGDTKSPLLAGIAHFITRVNAR